MTEVTYSEFTLSNEEDIRLLAGGESVAVTYEQ